MRCSSSISIVLLLVITVFVFLLLITINAVGNASAPSDEPVIDINVVHDREADAFRVVISRVRALVEDQGDAFDRASRRDGRKRLGWVGSFESYPRPLGRVLRRSRGLMVIGTPADERGPVSRIWLYIGH